MESSSTVFFGKAKGKTYLKTSVPFDLGTNVLGLRRDVKGQKLTWRIENGKVVVAGE